MSQWLYVVGLVTLIGGTNFAQDLQKKAIILFVGVHHLSDTVMHTLSPKRQQEIEEVVERLRKFQPTKIVCERQYRDNDKLFEIYNRYLNGDFQLVHDWKDTLLQSNEYFQIGFRLAKELNLDKVYGMDYQYFSRSPSPDSFARANNQEVFLQRWEEG